MAETIGVIVAFIVCVGIPYYLHCKEEGKKREDLYSPKSNDHSTDEWRR